MVLKMLSMALKVHQINFEWHNDQANIEKFVISCAVGFEMYAAKKNGDQD